MYSYLINILGLMDKIGELNEKLNAFAAEHLDNVFVGTAIIGFLILVAFGGVNTLNKK